MVPARALVIVGPVRCSRSLTLGAIAFEIWKRLLEAGVRTMDVWWTVLLPVGAMGQVPEG